MCIDEAGEVYFGAEYYTLMIVIAAFHRAVLYGQFVAIMAFFARISDPVRTVISIYN